MAEQTARDMFTHPVRNILKVIRLEKNEISSVYFYAILNGMIQLSLPLGIQSIISFVLGATISTSLIIMMSLVVLGVFLSGMLQVNQMRLIEKVQQKIFVRYSFEFAERIPKLDLQRVDSYYLPELVNRFFDTVSLQKGISKLLLDIPAASIQIIFGLLLLSFYHPVFIFFGIILVLIIYLILRFTSAKGMESSLRESDYKYAVAGWLEEMARVIKSFKFSRNTSLNIQRTDKLVTGYLQQRTVHFRVLLFQYWTLITFKLMITASMLIVGVILMVDQQLTVGQFIAAEIVIILVITSVEKLIINLDTVYDVLTAVEKLSKVTEKPLEEDGDIELIHEDKGLSVEMNNVTFSYDEDSIPILNNISFDIQSNETVCIMGATGSGKSTLLRLMSGAYNNFQGNIFVNNIQLSNYRLDSLRMQTGILLSQQDIFQGTLLENVTMGNSSISPQHVIKLAEKVGLKAFFGQLTDGLSTKIDPGGKKLSRNIVQKILLLRALVNHPRLVLLEEPFDGISDAAKRSVINYLLTETASQTILISCNDENFAAQCDKVIYLEKGTVKAIGKWNDIQEIVKQ
ncbi:MAG TPA: ATP-binding cassette domain-containing protein [Ferruginibacter sp.]|nr:ATP-binding cassette domain-containing protein [Ferruginibacter sp.]HPH89574.1 ATP-binding cassette domain-containing protein [Ferruginibacter sp.]